MANSSLNELKHLINKVVNTHEVLDQYLLKAKSLVEVAQGEDFWDHDESTINYYLWSTGDLIHLAEESSNTVRYDLLYLQKVVENESSDNIFKVLGFNAFEAEDLQLRSSMMRVLMSYMEKSDLTEEQAGKFFNTPIEVIKNILNGRIDVVKTEELLPMIDKMYLRE